MHFGCDAEIVPPDGKRRQDFADIGLVFIHLRRVYRSVADIDCRSERLRKFFALERKRAECPLVGPLEIYVHDVIATFRRFPATYRRMNMISRRSERNAVGAPLPSRIPAAMSEACTINETGVSPVRRNRDLMAAFCPSDLSNRRKLVGSWPNNAAASGNVGRFGKSGYPWIMWHRKGKTICEARTDSKGSGERHGNPPGRNQVVRGLR